MQIFRMPQTRTRNRRWAAGAAGPLQAPSTAHSDSRLHGNPKWKIMQWQRDSVISILTLWCRCQCGCL